MVWNSVLDDQVGLGAGQLTRIGYGSRLGSTHGSGWSSVKKSNKYAIYTQETDYSSIIIPNDKKL